MSQNAVKSMYELPCGCVVDVTEHTGNYYLRFQLRFPKDVCDLAKKLAKTARLKHWALEYGKGDGICWSNNSF